MIDIDIATVTQLIGSLGFPIVCCIALFWYMVKQNQTHKQEVDELKDAINNNSIVMQKLLDKLNGGETNA